MPLIRQSHAKLMERLYYDIHLHSCLSPCSDNDMTPNNIINMAVLKELDVIALTDHNSCKNCPAFVRAAENSGIIVIPGMELCTSEEIHAVCLFYDLESAMEFDSYVYKRCPDIINNTEAYGEQNIVDENDNLIGIEKKLLVTASEISIMDISELMKRFNGVCFPAHIDKNSYSILAMLGDIPAECGFCAAEIAKPQKYDNLKALYPQLGSMNITTSSDAHYLWDISERYYHLVCKERTASSFLDAIKSFNEKI